MTLIDDGYLDETPPPRRSGCSVLAFIVAAAVILAAVVTLMGGSWRPVGGTSGGFRPDTARPLAPSPPSRGLSSWPLTSRSQSAGEVLLASRRDWQPLRSASCRRSHIAGVEVGDKELANSTVSGLAVLGQTDRVKKGHRVPLVIDSVGAEHLRDGSRLDGVPASQVDLANDLDASADCQIRHLVLLSSAADVVTIYPRVDTVNTQSGGVGTALIGGWATFYSDPSQRIDHYAAAGPLLRDALGHWRGKVIRVTSGKHSTVVALRDFCACGRRHGLPTLLDLSPEAFRDLAPLSAGIVRVEIELVTLPATDALPRNTADLRMMREALDDGVYR